MNILLDDKKTLDITEFKQTGKKLIEAIVREVAHTQRFVIQKLPDELLMTSAQFDDLMKQTNTVSYMSAVNGVMDDGLFKGKVKKAYIFYTPLNAMDVRVQDSDAETLKENKQWSF